MSTVLYESHVEGLTLAFRGKVRDVYDLGEALLIVATDRLSAFDVVLPTPIPEKGRVLTALSRFWFERTRSLVPNHLLNNLRIEDVVPAAWVEHLALRRQIVCKAKPLSVGSHRARLPHQHRLEQAAARTRLAARGGTSDVGKVLRGAPPLDASSSVIAFSSRPHGHGATRTEKEAMLLQSATASLRARAFVMSASDAKHPAAGLR